MNDHWKREKKNHLDRMCVCVLLARKCQANRTSLHSSEWHFSSIILHKTQVKVIFIYLLLFVMILLRIEICFSPVRSAVQTYTHTLGNLDLLLLHWPLTKVKVASISVTLSSLHWLNCILYYTVC